MRYFSGELACSQYEMLKPISFEKQASLLKKDLITDPKSTHVQARWQLLKVQ